MEQIPRYPDHLQRECRSQGPVPIGVKGRADSHLAELIRLAEENRQTDQVVQG
jgi:hypothetical protein